MDMFRIPDRFRHRSLIRHPHTAGERSARHVQKIMKLSEHQRTPLQVRLLQQHLRGECIGCTSQGIPLDSHGNDLPLRPEPNGFAEPAEYCDCPKGQRYQQEMERQRATYDQERVQEHLRYVRYLFGSACVLPPIMAGWTLASWPVDLPFSEMWTEKEQAEVRGARANIVECIQVYRETLTIWDERTSKQGIALFGLPGVGKSGLLRCLEPLMLKRGLSMISLYVPDLMVALESEQVEQMIAAIIGTDVVLLDNLGFLVSLGYRETQGRLALIRLINARWERQQRILFTSNATEEQLMEQLGEDSVSRLHALCRFIEVPGVDLRKGGRE